MDQIMVNLEWDSAFNGDVVTLLGRDGDDVVTVSELAALGDLSPYELLTGLRGRLKRRYRSE